MSKDGFGSNAVQESIDQMKLTCGRMQRALENGPWLAGQDFSLADVVAAPLIDRIDDLGMGDIWTEEFPLVQDWFDRLKARASYDVAMYKGTRLSETHAIAALLKEED
jgi:glutathione S-transferase